MASPRELGNLGDAAGTTAPSNVNLDSGTLYVDAVNNRVGVGTTSPASTLDVNGEIRTQTFRISSDLNSYWTANELVLRGGAPTVYLRDTDSNSSALHNNSNFFYVLRGGNDTTSMTQVNGQWPLILNLNNNDATIGGSIAAIGNITAYASDKRLKENITEIPNALEKIKQIRGVTFDWNDITEKVGFVPSRKLNDVGVIAQEVEKILPQVVTQAPFDKWMPDPHTKYNDEELQKISGKSRSGENYKTVQYDKLTALLIQAVKELTAKVEELESRVK